MYPTTRNYTKEYKEMRMNKFGIVVIENLSGSIAAYLEAIIKDKNRITAGLSKIDFNIYETEDNNWNVAVKGKNYEVDELIKIADALMLYRYGQRVQVNGQKIGI